MKKQSVKNYTLTEMLIVLAIAMMLMSIGVGGYRRIAREQRLSIAGGAVRGVLDNARALSLREQRVVAVFFLDGGIYDGKNYNPSTSNLTNKKKVDAYYKRKDKTNPPYELATWILDYTVDTSVSTSAGGHEECFMREVSRTRLPDGIAWLDLAQTPDPDAYTEEARANPLAGESPVGWLVVAPNGQELLAKSRLPWETLSGERRYCSMVIKFSPAGLIWAEVIDTAGVFVDYDSPVDEQSALRTPDSCQKIRLADRERAIGEDLKEGIFAYTGFQASNKKPVDLAAKAAWKTVVINYNTGVSTLVNGRNE